MAIAPLVRIPTLSQRQPFVDNEGRLTNEALRTLNGILAQIAEAINQLAVLPIIQAALIEAQDAAEAAQGAADVAQAAAEAAQTQADAAQAEAEAIKREAALTGSYIEPDSVITATPTDITIASHTRYYADGTSVAVTGATVPATAPADVDYVSYVDVDRTGGAVTYVVSTTPPVQTGDTHVVGAVTIPAVGTANGGRGPSRPGEVLP